MSRFINLRTNSHYSIGKSVIKIEDLVDRCLKNDMPAIALTDVNNLFGSLEFSLACSKNGIQPIIGAVITTKFVFDKKEYNSNLLLLAKSREGYENLLFLISKSYFNDEESSQQIFINNELLAEKRKGLVLICGQFQSPIEQLFRDNRLAEAEKLILSFQKLFQDDFFIELARLTADFNQIYENFLIEQALKHNIPLVATNQTQFLNKNKIRSLDALMCITNSRFLIEDNREKAYQEYYLKNSVEMNRVFADIPEAIKNTELIAKKCSFILEESAPLLPKFCDTVDEEKELLSVTVKDKLEKRICHLNEEDRKPYLKRLDFELEVINKMNFAGYFLIVADFIDWAKKQNIPVGAGRGSGAGSLVAWSLGISDIDPIKFELLFERFLNPERVSMPDFDIDFCQSRRDEVIKYVRSKFGKDKVAHILTFGKLQARAVLRDVGRVLQIPYGKVDEICKMVPNNPANPVTLQEAISLDKKLRDESRNDEVIAELIDISLSLEGINRHVSTHAAGVVISDRELTKLVALYKDPQADMPIIQYSLKYAEKIGLVKFDFLGLKTLTTIFNSCELIEQRHSRKIDFSKVSLSDKNTYSMLTNGLCIGVFQFESSGMREVIKNIKPDKIEDLIALGSLYRPGPMDNIPQYVRRKHGLEDIEFVHPKLEDVLSETYGIIIYQEQVMKIAQILANYSLGEADLLRRAMGKKIKAEMEAQRDKFVLGCVSNNIKSAKANEIFNLVAKFASYGFNKSHAAAYAYISFQTAYLKANYTIEFIVSSLNLDIDHTDKIYIFLNEARRFNIEVLSPDINSSTCYFSANNKQQIVFGLSAIKGLGQKIINEVISERDKNGEFASIYDFFSRTISLGINKKLIEGLAKSGAFDIFSLTRQTILMNIEILLKYYNSLNTDYEQIDMFMEDNQTNSYHPELNVFSEMTCEEKLRAEFDVFGFYLKEHPLDNYQLFLDKLQVVSSTKLNDDIKKSYFKLMGVILSKKVRSTSRGKYAFLQIADLEGIMDIAIFDEALLLQNMDNLEVGKIIFCQVDRKVDHTGSRIIAKTLYNIDDYLYNANIFINVVLAKAEHIGLLRGMVNKTAGLKLSVNAKIGSSIVSFKAMQNILLDIKDLDKLLASDIAVSIF